VRRIIVITGFVGLLISACQGGSAQQQVTKGEELAFYNFTEPASFEEGSYGAAILRVNDGVYRIDVSQGDNTLWWGQWGDTYSDVVIDVDVEQITERNENAYGVMCRVRGTVGQPQAADPELAAIMEVATDEATETPEDEAEATDTSEADATDEADDEDIATDEATDVAETDEEDATEAPDEDEATPEATEVSFTEVELGEGDGYLFLIQGTGSYAIMRARGRAVVPLVDWTPSEHINVGPGTNHIRAICDGNYLALYVNDQFLAQATDDTYESGQVGLVASAANPLGVRVQFDNLSVSEAQSG
jgi:hypothetical protein